MLGVERAGAKRIAHLLPELAIRSQRNVKLAIDFAHHANPRIFRHAIGQQSIDL